MVFSALSLPGALTVVNSPLASAIDNSLNDTLTYAVALADRTSATGDLNFDYYIERVYNINSHIQYVAIDPSDNRDDAYALSKIDIKSTDLGGNTTFMLPTGVNIDVQAGEIDATDPSGVSRGKFNVQLKFNHSNLGVLTSSASILGDDVLADVQEDANKAQIAYWPGVQSVPTIDASSADIFYTAVTSAQLESTYITQMTQLRDAYPSTQMVSSWAIDVTAIPSSSDNALASRARSNNQAGSTSVFAPGEKMVVSEPFVYKVIIQDYIGTDITIVGNSNVYGVLKQS